MGNMRRLRLVLNIRDTFSPSKMAKEGFFYSHPRQTGLSVTCYSCGVVLGPDAFTTNLTSLHLPSCQRLTTDPSDSPWSLLPLRLVPLALVHTTIMAFTVTTFILTWETVAQATIGFLLLQASFSIGIVITISHTSHQLSNIFIGAANYFFPLFVPNASRKTMMFQLITLNALTNLLTVLVTSYYQKSGSTVISTTHWVDLTATLTLLVLTLFLTSCLNVCRIGRKIYWIVGH